MSKVGNLKFDDVIYNYEPGTGLKAEDGRLNVDIHEVLDAMAEQLRQEMLSALAYKPLEPAPRQAVPQSVE